MAGGTPPSRRVFRSRERRRPGHRGDRAFRRSGGRIRTCDLWVMSPASYRAAPPRVGSTSLHGVERPSPGVRVTAPSHESQARAPSLRRDAARLRVRHVAEDGGSRAFAGSPQPVEIHHRGIWYSGELLGWRHDADGRVLARVRCVVDRLRHSAWKDLAELRLPDPANPPHRAVAGPPAAAPEEDDATRPHLLMADLRSRPRTPEHVRTPPPRR